MSFLNRIRLPLYLLKPQFPEEKTVYSKSNGETVTLSASVKKTYALKTDWMPEKWHERLKVALLHDTVNIEGDKYAGGVRLEKMDEIEWQDFLDYPTAPVNGVVSVDPFFAINSNCKSCDEVVQIVTEDDDAGDVDEGETYEVDTAENDTLNCFPVTYEIVSFNSDYLENVSIDDQGVITFTVKEDLVAINGLSAIRYKASCENGNYDEADVYVNVLGTVEGCLAPTGLNYEFGEDFPTVATVSWLAPDPAPVNGYIWELYTADNLVTPIDTGTSVGLSADITLPDQGAQYVVMAQSDCDGTTSNKVQISITSPVNNTNNCAIYGLFYNDGTGIMTNTTYVSYIDCNNQLQTLLMYNLTNANICALQHATADPVYIVGATNVFYGGPC
jgi:hypothetical protein